MNARHTFLAIIVAMILLVLASVSARALDLSSYTGVQLYMRFCSSCHGDNARGDGHSDHRRCRPGIGHNFRVQWQSTL